MKVDVIVSKEQGKTTFTGVVTKEGPPEGSVTLQFASGVVVFKGTLQQGIDLLKQVAGLIL